MPFLPTPRDVVSVHRATTELEAQIIHDLLEDAGIHAMVRSRLVPGYDIPVPPGVWGDVLVRPEDKAEATRLIEEYLDVIRSGSEEPPAP